MHEARLSHNWNWFIRVFVVALAKIFIHFDEMQNMILLVWNSGDESEILIEFGGKREIVWIIQSNHYLIAEYFN